MKRLDKNKFQLPKDERQRTLNILQRALNVENGMDISPLQVTTDGGKYIVLNIYWREILALYSSSLLMLAFSLLCKIFRCYIQDNVQRIFYKYFSMPPLFLKKLI